MDDPMEKVMSVSLWSDDRYCTGTRLPFRAANDLAQEWCKRPPVERGAKHYAYVQDGMRTLKYVPSGIVVCMEPAL